MSKWQLQLKPLQSASSPTMPAQVRGYGNSPMDWYKSLPPVTKGHVTICVATTLAFMLQLIHPRDLLMHWAYIKKLQVHVFQDALRFSAQLKSHLATLWAIFIMEPSTPRVLPESCTDNVLTCSCSCGAWRQTTSSSASSVSSSSCKSCGCEYGHGTHACMQARSCAFCCERLVTE